MSKLRPYQGISPRLAEGVYIDPTATVIGQVTLGAQASVWPQVVIRGDVHRIEIGARTNIQDGAVLHVTRISPHHPEGCPLLIGEEVTVGHKAMLHGCQIGNRVLVGMGAIILDGVVVEDEVLIGAGSLVPPGKRLLSGHLYLGNPARCARPLTDEERLAFTRSAENYVQLKNDYLEAQ